MRAKIMKKVSNELEHITHTSSRNEWPNRVVKFLIHERLHCLKNMSSIDLSP